MSFNDDLIQKIDTLIDIAHSNGRTTLYEFEVYQILSTIGLKVPVFRHITSADEVTSDLLSVFANEIIIKIISPDISHKQKLGGVKKILNHDPLFVQFVLSEMKKEVLAHFKEEDKPKITGFIIVEYIQFREALGYEVMLGSKEDSAFGPVLTLTKGGDDAEFFAHHYDPANLLLPPVHYDTALKLANQLKISHKFKEIGHPEYLEYFADATAKLSDLATHYSFISKKTPRYIFKSMDINPIVITHDHRFVVLDGFAEFEPWEENGIQVPPIDLNNIDAFFHPQGIAVIGVSGDMAKYSLGRDVAVLLHNLKRDDLYLVNVKGGSIEIEDKEYSFYKSIKEIPHQVDLVVFAVPAQFTIDFFAEMKDFNIKCAILIAGIPPNIDYNDFAKELDKHVPKGVRIIGPNCMGVFYAPGPNEKGLNTLFMEQERLEIRYSDFSNTVLLTQSGALAVTEVDRLKDARIFKSIVSFGNKYDVKVTDLMAYFADQQTIDVIALYIEGFDPGEGRQFFQLAKKIDKPVIVYKSGRTEAGAKAAASHTASMSGDYEAFQAACDQSDVILANTIEDHYDYMKVFSLLTHKKITGFRTGGVLNAGFESTIAADEMKNLLLTELNQDTIDKIKKIDKYNIVNTSASLLDITPMADDKMYADYVEALLQDDNIDNVIVSVVPHPVTLKTTPDTCKDPDGIANLLVKLYKKYEKPMVISVNAGRYYEDFIAILEENDLPVYPDIRQTVKSLEKFITEKLG